MCSHACPQPIPIDKPSQWSRVLESQEITFLSAGHGSWSKAHLMTEATVIGTKICALAFHRLEISCFVFADSSLVSETCSRRACKDNKICLWATNNMLHIGAAPQDEPWFDVCHKISRLAEGDGVECCCSRQEITSTGIDQRATTVYNFQRSMKLKQRRHLSLWGESCHLSASCY